MIKGIVEGCLQAGCALVGGETAEMPGMYEGEDYDLAGFCVGLVEKDRIIDGTRTRAGDAIIGLASSGAHSNGYSLIRRLLAISGADPATQLDGKPLYDQLLAPTRIYVKSVLALLGQAVPVHGIAHITGGGPTGNIPRVLPAGLEAVIDARLWPRPPVFDWLQRVGNVARDEMYRTFNCGLGMTLCVPPGRRRPRARPAARLRRDGGGDRRGPDRRRRGRDRRMTTAAQAPLAVVVLVSGRGSNLQGHRRARRRRRTAGAHRGGDQRPRRRPARSTGRARRGIADARARTRGLRRPRQSTAARSASSSSSTRRAWWCWPASCAS